MKPINMILYIIIIFFLAAALSCNYRSEAKAENGLLDLSNWDFDSEGPVYLDGEWEFFWKEFILPDNFRSDNPHDAEYLKVPGAWNSKPHINKKSEPFGYGTYRLRVVLPDNHPASLGLRIAEIYSAYTAYANGGLIVSKGKIDKNEKYVQPELGYAFSIIDIKGNILELVINVSNYHFIAGGIAFKSLELGAIASLEYARKKDIVIELAVCASLFVMGLYHIGFYLIRRKEKAALFFGLFCILFALRTFMTGEKFALNLFFHMPFELMITLSHLPNYLGIPVWLLFVNSLFPEEVSKKWLYSAIIIETILSLVVLITPGKIYSFTMYPNNIIQFIIALYITSVFILALRRKRKGAYLYLTGWFFFLAIMFIELGGVIGLFRLMEIVPIGTFIFLFFQSIVLLFRFSRAFSQVEQISEKLLSIDKMKDDFLAKTSHELRTPLTAIISLAESMKEQTGHSLSEKQLNDLAIITRSGRRLLGLINDILDFSRLRNKQVVLQKKAVDMYSLTDIVIKQVEPLIVKKSLIIKNQIPRNLTLCYVDENRIEQVLLNLIGNSIKFTENGYITIDGKEIDSFIEISVTDTGIGIPEEKRTIIFDSFEQIEPPIVKQQGAGLGLAISKELIELHGGRISVESIPEERTSFIFSLPVFKGEISPSVRTAKNVAIPKEDISTDSIFLPSAIEGKLIKGSILIVDDEPVNLQVLINYLNNEGYRIFTAFNGEDALKYIEAPFKLDLVILDIMLPRMNGYEVCKTIREHYSLFELPVLMLTAKTRQTDMITGLSAGANDYVTKPFDKSEVLSRIKTLISLKKITDESDVLKRLYDLKKRIVYLISHELENSLYGIVFSTEQLIKRKKFGDTLIEQTINSIHNQSMEIMNIFEKYIEISKLESGNITLNKITLDIVALTRQVIAQNRQKALQKNQKIIFMQENNESVVMVEADKIYLSHIIENLVNNAVKFSPPGKSIWVKISTLSINGKPSVKLEIRDEGPGFTENDKENIFKEFHTLSARPTGGELSSGIGLSIVKQLVELHYGKIELVSAEGKGAIFIVTLHEKV